jgi:hypothetical protein
VSLMQEVGEERQDIRTLIVGNSDCVHAPSASFQGVINKILKEERKP